MEVEETAQAGVSGTKRPAPSPTASNAASPVKEDQQGKSRGERLQQAAHGSYLAAARHGARGKARKQLPFSQQGRAEDAGPDLPSLDLSPPDDNTG